MTSCLNIPNFTDYSTIKFMPPTPLFSLSILHMVTSVALECVEAYSLAFVKAFLALLQYH